MVQYQETENFPDSQSLYNDPGPNLLKKFDIPIDHLDFEYVNTCKNGDELEKIIQILQSGQEGFYPQLLERTEQKLMEIKPNSKFLRKVEKVLNKNDLKDDYNEISGDLRKWLDDISKKNEELEAVRHKSKGDLPEVRKSKEINVENKKKESNRIKSTDYSAWDKYDVETELLKMDLEDKKLKAEAEKLKEQQAKKPKVKFNPFLTRAEAIFEAQRENEKANEYFKAKETENSIEHYNNSILYHRNPTTFKNRASAYMKLKKYEDAINDYKEALKYNERDFECLFRMAQCYHELKKYHEANAYIENAIFINPNDTAAQKLAETIRKTIGKDKETGTKTRMKISNIDDKIETNKEIKKKPILKNAKDDKVIVPIPGSSRMPGPYFKVVDRKELPESEKVGKKKTVNFNANDNKTEISKKGNKKTEEIVANKGIDMKEVNRVVKSKINEAENGKNNDVQKSKIIKVNEFENKNCKLEDNKPKIIELENVNNYDDKEKLNQNFKENKLQIIELENDSYGVNEKMIENCDGEENKNDENKTIKNQIPLPERQITFEEDLKAGGEPCNNNQEMNPEQIHMPYSFISAWLSARKENNYEGFATILRSLEPQRLTEVIGNKLDATMLNEMLNCLYRHFTVVHEVERVYNILANLTSVSRFNIIAMFLPQEDKTLLCNLVNFLKQHGKNIPNNILQQYNLL